MRGALKAHRPLRPCPLRRNWAVMSWLSKAFAWGGWWNGATISTRMFTARKGRLVGEDGQGNRYYEGGVGVTGLPRRWVIYSGANDASRVPPDWHSWLHNSVGELPDQSLPPPRRWELEAKPNLTGTDKAYLPAGALEAGGKRAAAVGDYEPWTPDAGQA